MKTALLQFCASDDPMDNTARLGSMLDEAAKAGAEFVLTPEVSNCLSVSRAHQRGVLRLQEDDEMLSAFQDRARAHAIWILIGSLALKTKDPDGRFANRSCLINPDGKLVAAYDKIHMFDVAVTKQETYRESEGYRPGNQAVVAPTPFGKLGLSICYDLRFPLLYRALAEAGARILTIPAAFSPVTGAAHWEALLRARAIETGCFVLAPAQTRTHPAQQGRARQTYGHSMAISPWGEVILDAGIEPGVFLTDLDMEEVDRARNRVPSLLNARAFGGPA